MNTFLWALQIFLAITFSYSGVMKSTQSRERLVKIGQTGVDNLPYSLIRLIGFTEMLGVVGIILPIAVNILPILTPVTAICFALIMLLAAPIHFKRREFKSIMINVTLFEISAFVAYMRLCQLVGGKF